MEHQINQRAVFASHAAARTTFDTGQFTESKKFIAVALELEPDDVSAIRLRVEASEAEKKVEDARKEAEAQANQAKDEAGRKEFAEQAAEKRKEFENALSKLTENGYFEIHTREFPYSFETVWQAAISILLKEDKDSEVNVTHRYSLAKEPV